MSFLFLVAPEKISKMTMWLEEKKFKYQMKNQGFPWDDILKVGFQINTKAASLIKNLSETDTRTMPTSNKPRCRTSRERI